ncbi:hypothetical protein [Pelagicoccus sp. SDUM812003]|uniref:hypothetical protein n=1 Tax=Pelagicoccus sp. SDUM812003 TaxID=3041267 RepID=UPI00280FA20C|nr:hypothetical protein [Pelagicoccus sp. SDUM812003]MDQ8202516.1 hypothetical protein [Pelagicoccus sp. SDUM812003]
MTQSESPDFEFDPTDLEVEGEDAPTPEQGGDVSDESESNEPDYSSEVSEDKSLREDSSEDDPSDDELSGFDIDSLPDAFSPSEPSASDDGADSSRDPADRPTSSETVANSQTEDESVGAVEKMPKEPPERSMRDLGPDDLGADVFSEMFEDEEAVSFDDVLDDLMEQVEAFEAGGVIDMDEQEGDGDSRASETPDIFKLDDPDDSLQRSVDPNAEAPSRAKKPQAPPPVEVEQSKPLADTPSPDPRSIAASEPPAPSETSQSSPPAEAKADVEPPRPVSPDLEIPADPELSGPKAPQASSQVTPSSAPAPEPVESQAAESEPVSPRRATETKGATGAAASPPPSPDMEIPADPVQAEEPPVEQTSEKEPREEQVPEETAQPSGSQADSPDRGQPNSERAPAEGRERVFYQAEPEAPANEQENDTSAEEPVSEGTEPVAETPSEGPLEQESEADASVKDEEFQVDQTEAVASELSDSRSAEFEAEAAETEQDLSDSVEALFEEADEEPVELENAAAGEDEAPEAVEQTNALDEEESVASELEEIAEETPASETPDDPQSENPSAEAEEDEDADLSDIEAIFEEEDIENPDAVSDDGSAPVEQEETEQADQLEAEEEIEQDSVADAAVEDGFGEEEDEDADLSDIEAIFEDEAEEDSTPEEMVDESAAAASEETVSDAEQEGNTETVSQDAQLESDEEETSDQGEELDTELSEDLDAEEEDLSDIAAAFEEAEDESSAEPEGASEALDEAEQDDDEEEIALPDDQELTDEVADEAPSDPAAPGLEILDDDDEEETLDDDEEEIAAMPSPLDLMSEASGDSDEDEPEETIEDDDEEEAKAVAMPTAEDLLKRAGSLLNGDKPIDGANELLDDLDDEEEITAMPSPQDLMAEAAPEGSEDISDAPEAEDGIIEDDEEGLVAMPDPSSLMESASEGESEQQEEKKSGDVADRAGDLPPPPPAPVEIIDDDPLDEDEIADSEESGSEMIEDDEDPEAILAKVTGQTIQADGDEIADPFDSEISIDDFDDDGALEDALSASEDAGELDALASDAGEKAPTKVVEKVIEMPKPSLLWRLTHSLTVAAGLVLIGAAWLLTSWKQEITEYLDGRDLDGSALIQQIKSIGSHALEEFDENGLYRMQWVDSEIRRVAHNEIRLHALVGAQLRENLYLPVHESEIDGKQGYDEEELLNALTYAQQNFPEQIGNFPEKPWRALYRMSASRNEVLPLRITYSLTRDSEKSDWELAGIKVKGHKKELEWPQGKPAYAYGDHAYDVDSDQFRRLLAKYQESSSQFVASIDSLKGSYEEKLASLQRENDKRRERVMMALSPGNFYDGLAIVGEDAAVSQGVTIVITETRERGSLVKGVFQVREEGGSVSKMFVGSVDFETLPSGREQGVLNLRTVAVQEAEAPETEARFFKPESVSSIRLKTDGFRIEGDTRDFSLRLTRHM